MTRVTGIGGIFIKARDPKALGEWYRKHLGIDVQEWGGTAFRWNEPSPQPEGLTVWSLFPESSTYFEPSHAPFMVNYRVGNLAELLDTLRAEGCSVDEKTDSSEFGKFGWVMDPEGNRIELWEPPPGRFPG
ncbi:MAG: VOC family protein [Thermoanaerobaculia bacterium]|jgi:predicted enzyme related to lactoylglutathione lyase